MRIAIISTYPPIECGIGTYTNFFVSELKKIPNEVYVITQYGAQGQNVFPAYDTSHPDIARRIFSMTDRFTPDIVHIQHEYGLFGEMDGIAVIELIYRFKSIGTPVIATFHTVFEEPTRGQKLVMEAMCRELDAIIVHERKHADILPNIYGCDKNKIHIIPHGARILDPVPDAKRTLGLEGKRVILLAGYYRTTKCFDKIVDIMPEIVKKCPDALLLISGKIRRLDHIRLRAPVLEKVNQSPVRDHIEVFRGQFPQKTFDTIISASDIMVFPYSIGAQSGVMAHALAFGKPVVTSDLPAFKAAIEASKAGFFASNKTEYVEKIVKLLNDRELYEKCAANALKYVKEKISWKIVAHKTCELYRKLDKELECSSRYIEIY